ncbi:MAG: hypothetical protein ABIP94_17485 [Planctomycetota bacterium]
MACSFNASSSPAQMLVDRRVCILSRYLKKLSLLALVAVVRLSRHESARSPKATRLNVLSAAKLSTACRSSRRATSNLFSPLPHSSRMLPDASTMNSTRVPRTGMPKKEPAVVFLASAGRATFSLGSASVKVSRTSSHHFRHCAGWSAGNTAPVSDTSSSWARNGTSRDLFASLRTSLSMA